MAKKIPRNAEQEEAIMVRVSSDDKALIERAVEVESRRLDIFIGVGPWLRRLGLREARKLIAEEESAAPPPPTKHTR